MYIQLSHLFEKTIAHFDRCLIFPRIAHIIHDGKKIKLVLKLKNHRIPHFLIAVLTCYLTFRLPESLVAQNMQIGIMHLGIVISFFFIIYCLHFLRYRTGDLNRFIALCVQFSYNIESKLFFNSM